MNYQIYCAKCHKVPVSHVKKYCPSCKAKSIAEEKEKKRQYQLRYKKQLALNTPPKPRVCRTVDCNNEPNKCCSYCPSCSAKHKNQVKRYPERRVHKATPPNKTTDYDWKDDINTWLAEHNHVYNPKPTDMPIKPHESKILYVRI